MPTDRTLSRLAALLVCAAAAVPSQVQAAGAQLSIQQVVIKKHVGLVNDGLSAKAFVNVLGNSGSPIQGLSHDLFKVYEGGAKNSQHVLKVETVSYTHLTLPTILRV